MSDDDWTLEASKWFWGEGDAAAERREEIRREMRLRGLRTEDARKAYVQRCFEEAQRMDHLRYGEIMAGVEIYERVRDGRAED